MPVHILQTTLSRLIKAALLAVLLLYILFPVYWLVLSSLKTPGTITVVDYLPRTFSTLNYSFVITNGNFVRSVYNSVIVAVAAVGLTLALGGLAAYAIGRLRFRGRGPLRYIILGMIAFPQIVLVPGLYPLFTDPCAIIGGSCRALRLYNTTAGVTLTHLLLTLPLTIWFLAAYFQRLPPDLEEAAYVDGASPLQAFTRVLLPNATPGLIATGMLAFIASWNDFLFALFFTQTLDSRTAPVALAAFGFIGGGALLTFAASVLLTLPVLVLTLTFQRYITAGLTGRVEEVLDAPSDARLNWQKLASIRLSGAMTALLLALGVAFVGAVIYAWRVILFPYQVDYGEAPLLDQALRLARGQNIYHADLAQPPYTIANYPPIFPLLQAPLTWLFGPAFWYGRLITWVCTLVAAACIAGILNTLTRDRLAALIGALVFLANSYVSFWAPLSRVDTPALTLSLAALFVLVRRHEQRGSLALTAVLLVAAVYTRQSYGLAAPLAACAWLVFQRRYRAAVTLVALVAAPGLALFVVLNVLTGGGFVTHIVLANLNEYQVDLLFSYISELVRLMPVLLLGGAVFLVSGLWRRDLAWRLIAPYLVGATVVSFTIGKIGSNVNYLLELAAAMALAIGALFAWVRSRPRLQLVAALTLALQIVLLLPGTRAHLITQFRLTQSDDLAQIRRLVEQSNGPVLADEDLGLLPQTGRQIYLQPFEFTQLAREGVWDQAPLLRDIEERRFSLILIFAPPRTDLPSERWTPEMLARIREYYTLVETIGNRQVYRPRPGVGGQGSGAGNYSRGEGSGARDQERCGITRPHLIRQPAQQFCPPL
jgi:trehalose/maltose transport system permease protein